MAIYRPARGVRWAVEADGLLLADGAGRVVRIGYPEAAIWDLMARGYRHGKLVPLMTHIAALEPAAAGELVADQLEQWVARGWLHKELGDG